MQMAIVEFARHVLDIRDAHSIELDPQTAHPVIHLMPDQMMSLTSVVHYVLALIHVS